MAKRKPKAKEPEPQPRSLAAEALERWREENKLTLDAVGVRVGLSRQAVCVYENGSATPSLRAAVRIERVTGGAVRAIEWVLP